MAVVILTASFFVLDGLLWYQRPNGGIWLAGSLVLGVAWGIAFMYLITRPK
jgi:hypothetical protein